MHGGIVVEGKQTDFELVAKPDVIQLYLSDHGKKMDHSKASAKVTLLTGSEKQEVALFSANAHQRPLRSHGRRQVEMRVACCAGPVVIMRLQLCVLRLMLARKTARTRFLSTIGAGASP